MKKLGTYVGNLRYSVPQKGPIFFHNGSNYDYHFAIKELAEEFKKQFRQRRQLGFTTLNGNLAVNLKLTHPPVLSGKGQLAFLKTESSHSSGIVVFPPKFKFLRN